MAKKKVNHYKDCWTVAGYAKEFSVSKSAARYNLEKLVAMGKFEKYKIPEHRVELYGGFRPEIRTYQVTHYQEL